MLDTFKSEAPNPTSRQSAAEVLASAIKNAGLILVGATAKINADQNSIVYGIYGFLISGSVLAMIGSAFAVIVISRQIIPPIKTTASVAQSIAADDLLEVAPSDRRDEIGQLQRATHSSAWAFEIWLDV